MTVSSRLLKLHDMSRGLTGFTYNNLSEERLLFHYKNIRLMSDAIKRLDEIRRIFFVPLEDEIFETSTIWLKCLLLRAAIYERWFQIQSEKDIRHE